MTAGNFVITGRLDQPAAAVRTDIVILPISWKVPVVVSSLAYCPGTHKHLIKC